MYRSSNAPSGYFRKLGTLHVHVDGSNQNDELNNLIRELGTEGREIKLTAISSIAVGPQRKELAGTYLNHNPIIDDSEALECFSTVLVRNRAEAIQTIAMALSRLAKTDGIVVEMERVVATIDVNGYWSSVPFDDVSPIASSEVGFEKAQTLPFEIHHALDMAIEEQRLTVERLVETCNRLGIPIGGWFHFEKDDCLSYRSNAFAECDGLQEKVSHELKLLDEYLQRTGASYKLWTIVERVLGVWRTPPVAMVSRSEVSDLLDDAPKAVGYKRV